MLIACIFVLGCQDKSAQGAEIKVGYLQFLEEYPKGLTKHFPEEKEIKPGYLTQYTYLSEYSPSQFIVKQKESKSKIDSLISVSRKIVYSDTSYYIVNKYLRDSNILSITNNYKQFKTQIEHQGAIPIPNFYDVNDFDDNSYNLLNKSYTIYLIEAEPKKCCS
jgi:hypothetical protein